MAKNIPEFKRQMIKATLGLCAVVFALYCKKIYHESSVDRICNEHAVITKSFMETIQYTGVSKSEFLDYLYKKRIYFDDEQKRVNVYMNMAYKYPIGKTREEKDDLVKKFGHETYEFCMAHKADISN